MNNQSELKTKPPLGIEPEYIWKQKRAFVLVEAIARYSTAGMSVRYQWFVELGKLIPEILRPHDNIAANDWEVQGGREMNIHDELKRLNAKCDRLAESLRRKNKFAAVTEGGAGESRHERPEPSQLLTPAISPQLSNRLTPETDAALVDHMPKDATEWSEQYLTLCIHSRKLERERDEAREQRDALAEALKQCREDSVELLGERDWWQTETRLDYKQRYQATRDNIDRAEKAIKSLSNQKK